MAKTQRPTGGAIAAANDRGSKKAVPAVTDAEVARRAYDLYMARGCADGHDVDDWLQAERELRGAHAD
jgi:hypothetical protein